MELLLNILFYTFLLFITGIMIYRLSVFKYMQTPLFGIQEGLDDHVETSLVAIQSALSMVKESYFDSIPEWSKKYPNIQESVNSMIMDIQKFIDNSNNSSEQLSDLKTGCLEKIKKMKEQLKQHPYIDKMNTDLFDNIEKSFNSIKE